MIIHTVTFKLKHPSGSTEESAFLEAARKLSTIPNVQKFECLKEISKNNNFDFGLSMEFEDMDNYQAYNNHPEHVSFVQTMWIPQVSDYIEIDYEF